MKHVPINQRSTRIKKAGLFSRWQPKYAAHNVATFPVLITEEAKRPAITNYGRVGLPGSAELATKRQFANANAFGFMTGPRSKITVLDVDTTDEAILANALDQHGQSPLVVRSVSGKFHAYYRHNGERRKIRPWRGLAIDLLGTGGFVVAPPSEVAKGSYSFIQGTLDELDQLPALRNLDLPQPKQPSAIDGERNKKLWHHCMGAAHHVENFDELLDVARTFHDDCLPPSDDSEVIKAAQSAWRKTERGENWFEAELVRRHGQLLQQRTPETAEALFWEAIGIARKQEAKLWELRAAASLAHLWLGQGRRTEARDLLAPIYGWFTEGFDTPDLKEAKALLDELA